MAKYKAYPEYKDSGIESLDTIPKMWSIKKLKYIFEIKKRIAGKIGFDVLSVTQKGIKIKDIESGEGQLSMDYSKYQKVYPGEFAMNHMDLLTGYVDISNYDGVTSPDYRVFAVRDKHSFYSRYYLYLLQDGYKQRRFFHLGQGSAHLGRWRLPTEAFNEIVYPCPSLKEQTQIASFLDHETTKIDNLIEKQQQLIELMKEKRQAVISHAVTKGLNPDVPMKDSGVEWLGPISQHCIITKLKYLTVLKTEKTVSNNIRYVGMENISSGTGKFLSKDEMIPEGTSVSFECNDVLFGKLRPYLAKSWLATFSGICSSEFLVLQPKKIHARYLNYYLLTNEFIKQVDSSTYGSKMPRANWDFISQLPVPTWTYEESKAIAVYLDNLTAKLDCLLEKQNQQVNLLQERRTALISAAVTGKIDVRDWVAPDTQDIEVSQEATA